MQSAMKYFTMLALVNGVAIIAPVAALSYSNTTTMPLTTLSQSIITSSISSNISIPFASTSTSAGSTTVAVTLPTGPVVPIPTTPAADGEYKLRVEVIKGPRRFKGQYLAAWDVDTGYVNDAVFTKNKTEAAKFYLNGTVEQMDIGTVGQYWAMDINFDTINAKWYRVTMDSPYNNDFGTFWVNGTGLQWTPNETPGPHAAGVASEIDNYFSGWIVCDWWHDAPQLFYKVGLIYNDTVIPSSCADINLVPEYFKN